MCGMGICFREQFLEQCMSYEVGDMEEGDTDNTVCILVTLLMDLVIYYYY